MIAPGSGEAPQVHPLEPGDPQELGGYPLLGRIGAGGMGAVYLAETRTGRKLALKAILREHVQDPEFRTRFRREAAAAMKVRGRFLATLIDADPDGDQPWLAVEYVAGPALSAVVRTQGPLPEPDVRRILAGVAEALRSVHQVGIVHRDLKPSNILLAQDGPYVIDFGIAQGSDSTSLTRTGLKVGTPAFMAPEQVRGSLATPAADVWALGAVALYAATGQRAFGEGDTTVVYYRVVHEEPDLSGCPEWLLPLVQACLAKDPEARPGLPEVLDFLNEVPADGRTGAAKILPAGAGGAAGAAGAAAGSEDDDATALRDDGTVVRADGPTSAAATSSTTSASEPAAGPASRPASEPAPEPASGTEPEPQAPRRGLLTRPITWIVAAAVVVIVGGGTTAAVLGLRSGEAEAGTTGTPTASGPASEPAPASGEPSASAPTAPPSVIDECLVGRWEQTDLATEISAQSETYPTTGWTGRVVEFRPDGTQVVEFDDAEPLRADLPAGEYVETWSGTATYTVSTKGGTLTFETVDFGDTEVTRKLGDNGDTYEPEGLSQPLEYTCDKTTHTQWTAGFEATFRRLDHPPS
ncbi:protein kinase [Promicromonospora sp. NPDC060204]|uniref:serine/threonine-protein kinase n=1 Tax=Promicromonospora sp. NPDC060204 TaxID=3347071 RepID=UPI0036496E96